MSPEFIEQKVTEYLEVLDSAANARVHDTLYAGPIQEIMMLLHHHLSPRRISPGLLSYGFHFEAGDDQLDIIFTDATRVLFLPAEEQASTHPFPKYATLTVRPLSAEEAVSYVSLPPRSSEDLLKDYRTYLGQWMDEKEQGPFLIGVGGLMIDAFFGNQGHGFKLAETHQGVIDSVDDAYRFRAYNRKLRVDWEFHQQVLTDVRDYWERVNARRHLDKKA